jgi:hypothetical protein
MTVEMVQENLGKVVTIRVSGKLDADDYQRFVPLFEEAIAEHGKIRLIFEMVDFHGWKAGALWEDLKVDFKHFNDLERIAFIGDRAWEKGMSVFCRPFTTAKIRYFEHDQREEARRWIEEGLSS